MAENIKVLVTGSTNGKFKELFTKVTQIHQKYGPFDVHLCTGNFFSPETTEETLQELINNRIDIPIMTYFIIGDQPIPDIVQKHIDTTDGEVCNNLYFIGKQGVLTTSEGLRIAFISGTYNETTSASNSYTKADIQKLSLTRTPATSPPGVDFLLSHEWPEGISEVSAVTMNAEKSCVQISELATALKPRYHFAASQSIFFERDPYKNVVTKGSDERPALHATRFIGLGDVLNPEKQRWFYAFNLVPLSKAPVESLEVLPPNTTEYPFTQALSSNGQKRGLEEDSNGSFFWGNDNKKTKPNEPRKGYVCKRCNVPGHFIKDCPQAYICNICKQTGHLINDCPERQNRRRPEQPSYSCWFCLANPKAEKHLIVSVGEELYLTLAKGPVVSGDDSESTVPGKGHVLIVPITHYPTFGKVPAESQDAVVKELDSYKRSLKKLFDQYDQDMVLFEVSRESHKGMSHALIQVVPIPRSKSDQIESIAREQGQAAGMNFVDQIPQNPDIPYFRLELPNGKSLVHIMQPKERFNIQFGRLVTATILGKPEREDWKMCSLTEEMEKKDAELFKNAFKSYDFTLE